MIVLNLKETLEKDLGSKRKHRILDEIGLEPQDISMEIPGKDHLRAKRSIKSGLIVGEGVRALL